MVATRTRWAGKVDLWAVGFPSGALGLAGAQWRRVKDAPPYLWRGRAFGVVGRGLRTRWGAG